MNDSRILSSMADDKFRAIAYAEYAERAQQRYAQLLEMMSSIESHLDDRDNLDDSMVAPLTDAEISQKADAIMAQYGYSQDVAMPLSEGYTTLKEVVKASIMNADSAINFCNYDTQYVGYDDSPINIKQLNVIGQEVGVMSITMNSVGQQLQSNLHSITCLAAAARSYADKLEGKISDVITRFNDKLADVFANAHADISSSVSYFKDLLINSNSAQDFITQSVKAMGLKNEAEATEGSGDDFIVSDSDVYKYTGASPSCAIDFSTAAKIGQTVIKAAATVSIGIVKGIWNVGKAIFTKIFNKLGEIVIDPNDLDVIDEKGTNTIDGFCHQFSFGSRTVSMLGNPTIQQTQKFIADMTNKHLNQWYVTKLKFGEVAIKYTAFNAVSAGVVTYQGIVSLKPKIINADVYKNVAGKYTLNSMNENNINDLLIDLENQGAALYDISNLDEKKAAEGMLISIYLLCKLSQAGLDTLIDRYDRPTSWNLSQSTNFTIPDTDTITNAWWLQAACGWNGSQLNYDVWSLWPHTSEDWANNCYTTVVGQNWSEAILLVMGFEYSNPLDEIPFVPYSCNSTNYSPSKFRIKSDEQNINAFNTFLTVVTVVIIVAVVATTALVAIKKYNQHRFMKYTQTIGALDNKMWNADGTAEHPFLTKKEKKKYLRAKRRLEKVNLFSGALNNPVSAFSSSPATPMSDNDIIEETYHSIVGR